MDFVTERINGGGYFRIPTAIDQFTRECLALLAGRSLRGKDVANCLSQIVAKRSRPTFITIDDESESCSREEGEWAYRLQVDARSRSAW